MKIKCLIVAFFCFGIAVAQQNFTLKDCDDALQKNNLQLLAQQYNISAAQAGIIQAKIWEQPVVTADVNAYNPEARRYFDIGTNGQKFFAVEQLIYLGGKKKNEIRFAKTNAEIAGLQFEELLFNLKGQLHRSFYSVYFDNKKIAAIELQISQIEALLKSYEVQADKGNIPLGDVVRLQSLVLNLKNDRIEIIRNNTSERQNLNFLTGIDGIITPSINEKEIVQNFKTEKFKKDELLALAKEKNPEFLIAQKNIEAQQIAVKWQKALSVPDITAGMAYDQNSGAFHDQVNVTLGIPLPLWNKNKGNIKIAEAQLGETKAKAEFQSNLLKSNIESAYNIWKIQQSESENLKESACQNLETVYKGVLFNFQKRNISLFEFTDFMESYNQSNLQINEIYKQLILSGETLNHITNTNLF
ncbi:hypothetical protein FNO01nite_00330 [Flavobacterium noncentrifugens]|uniref:Outer membrane protein, cobalt-zinc-cadmium efflux system n=1 Tax=Flavobacterium noncentrifugens TaxID=1128970 RepID=A0A1G8RAX2_9FLAO|nr:TolC family protein [Flavobacterium noncentrifugens]GEP49361.1 hypothetical protein FNO01nite_00330 [Flavobacterium noncentrifugens]SDJ14126.1 outer membrane protein, cobalt-zinc-cadmium efflux system [Flavobacterium noncentrifugens]